MLSVEQNLNDAMLPVRTFEVDLTVNLNTQVLIDSLVSKQAEAQLIEQLLPKLNRLVRNTVWDTNAVEDIRQDVLEVVIRKHREGAIIKLDSVISFAAGVCRNLRFAHGRRRKRDTELFISKDQEELSLTEADESFGVLQILLKNESLSQLKQAMQNLAQTRDKVLLMLYYLNDRSVACLCYQFELTEAHFYRVLYRARKRLGVELQKLNRQ
jgi:RNA polymerase sigma-70 factor (ECF subfamily)